MRRVELHKQRRLAVRRPAEAVARGPLQLHLHGPACLVVGRRALHRAGRPRPREVRDLKLLVGGSDRGAPAAHEPSRGIDHVGVEGVVRARRVCRDGCRVCRDGCRVCRDGCRDGCRGRWHSCRVRRDGCRGRRHSCRGRRHGCRGYRHGCRRCRCRGRGGRAGQCVEQGLDGQVERGRAREFEVGLIAGAADEDVAAPVVDSVRARPERAERSITRTDGVVDSRKVIRVDPVVLADERFVGDANGRVRGVNTRDRVAGANVVADLVARPSDGGRPVRSDVLCGSRVTREVRLCSAARVGAGHEHEPPDL